MNVIICNKEKEKLNNLNIDIIKCMEGIYSIDDILNTFNNFFFDKLIIDVTAIKEYNNIDILNLLGERLDANKIILLLPGNDIVSSTVFISRLIDCGFYNFTTNINEIIDLLNKPKGYNDVSHLKNVEGIVPEKIEKFNIKAKVLGIKNITEHAGATTLIYMLKNALEKDNSRVGILEYNKRDFVYFNNVNAVSTEKKYLAIDLLKLQGNDIILVDLNELEDVSFCDDVLYLVEPTTIKLNKLIKKDKNIFDKIYNKKIVLNKSVLNGTSIGDFEYESKSRIFYNIPNLDDKNNNKSINILLKKLNVMSSFTKKRSIFDIFN